MAYFDHASTAPLHPAAREVLLAAYDEGWADPARLYGAARKARLLLDAAREQVAAAIGARADELSFPASGTASVHLAVLGALRARTRTGRHLVTTAVEHSAVLAAADWHEREHGGTQTRVGVDEHGRVTAADVAAALRDDTALVSVQHANHEVGTVQPVEEVAEVCARRQVPLHVDAAQTVGRVPVDVAALGAGLLSASAHKWGGPPGVGVLVVRKGTRWRSPGPGDDRGAAPGFPNLPAVLAAATALDARRAEIAEESPRLSALVDLVRAEVPRRVPDVAVVGDPVHRLPHLVTFSVLYVDGEAIVTELDRYGFAVNSGSSCTSSTLRPSHVLEAMGVLSHGNVRVSLGRDTTAADVERMLDVLPAVVGGLRRATATEGL